jgi:two-component system response regulator HydG
LAMEKHDENSESRLLLVDDEEEFLDATAWALRRRGFEVYTARRGEAALALLGRQVFDVVVLDVKMPGMDGVDVFRQIKRILPWLPVILLTGHGNVQQAFQTSKEGVFEYLSKPCSIEELAEIATRAVGFARQVRMLAAPDSGDEVRLLFVDDELELLESLSASLRRRGMKVTTAPGGNEALGLVANRSFDVALVDVKMAGMDGIAFTRRLKEQDPLIEVILLTGHPSIASAVGGFKEGVFDVLMKPQSPEVIAEKIRAAFRVRELNARQKQERRLDGIIKDMPD